MIGVKMKKNKFLLSVFYILWACLLSLGVNYANNPVRFTLAERFPNVHIFVYDIFSDAVWLFVALMVAAWSPRFFGYQIGDIFKHKKMLVVLAAIFLLIPIFYRFIAGDTPFSTNTWFFEGIVVPVAEEGFFRGIIFSMLLKGFSAIYTQRNAERIAIIISALSFAILHLANIGSYPTPFVIFQVFYSTIFGLLFGYSRMKTKSIYPAIVFHAILNLAATL
jgi:membrane protease YdiL (CAAX protease family)